MAKYLIVAVFALAAFAGRGQIVGESWRDHLSYNNGKALAVT